MKPLEMAEHRAIQKENDRKKAYLRQYGEALRAERQINEEMNQLRLDTMMPAVTNDGMPHGSGGCGDLSGYAAKMDELMAELKEQLEKRIAIRREIVRAIEELPDETEKLILRYRYIHLLKFEEIAEKIHYSPHHVLKIHGNALRHFKVDTK